MTAAGVNLISERFGRNCRGGPPWPPLVYTRIQEATASDLANSL